MAPLPEDERVGLLQAQFPNSPEAQLRRFARARPKSVDAAAKMHTDHLRWREGDGRGAVLAEAAGGVPDKWVRALDGRAPDGSPVIYTQGARYDPAIAPQTYMRACAHLIDSLVGPADLTKLTILIDVRGGEGWPNPPVTDLLPFFKLANAVLAANYPERAGRIVVYPLPSVVKTTWAMISRALDPVTRDKFVVVAARGKRECPPEVLCRPAFVLGSPRHTKPLGSVNAETTPAGAPAAAADRTQRPDATCEGKSG